jgi:hypothetical protein
MAIKTITGFWRGRTKGGRDCLKTTLRKRLIIEDEDGGQHVYAPGTTLLFLKADNRRTEKSPEYNLLALVDDEAAVYAAPATMPTAAPSEGWQPEREPSGSPTLVNAHQQQRSETEPSDMIPF